MTPSNRRSSDPLDPRNEAGKPAIRNRELYYEDDVIIEQGDDAIRAYYIESGRVEVSVKENNKELKVAELGPGDIFGEMALIGRSKRTATVKSLDATTVITISNDDLNRRLDNVKDDAVKALIFMFIKRLNQTTKGQLKQFVSLSDFQDRISGVVDRVGGEFDPKKQEEFRNEVEPLLEKLEAVMDKYKAI